MVVYRKAFGWLVVAAGACYSVKLISERQFLRFPKTYIQKLKEALSQKMLSQLPKKNLYDKNQHQHQQQGRWKTTLQNKAKKLISAHSLFRWKYKSSTKQVRPTRNDITSKCPLKGIKKSEAKQYFRLVATLLHFLFVSFYSFCRAPECGHFGHHNCWE